MGKECRVGSADRRVCGLRLSVVWRESSKGGGRKDADRKVGSPRYPGNALTSIGFAACSVERLGLSMGLWPTRGNENQGRRPRESGDPLSVKWIPACPGMTYMARFSASSADRRVCGLRLSVVWRQSSKGGDRKDADRKVGGPRYAALIPQSGNAVFIGCAPGRFLQQCLSPYSRKSSTGRPARTSN